MDSSGTGKSAGHDTLTDQLRGWYERSPTAQRAYARIRTDLDAVMDKAQPKIEEFWRQIGPMIDPPPKDDAAPSPDRDHAAASTPPGPSTGAATTSGSQPS